MKTPFARALRVGLLSSVAWSVVAPRDAPAALVDYTDLSRGVYYESGSTGSGRYTTNEGYWSRDWFEANSSVLSGARQISTIDDSGMVMEGHAQSNSGGRGRSTLVASFVLNSPAAYQFDVSLVKTTSSILAYYEFSLTGPGGTVFTMGDRYSYDTMPTPFEEHRSGLLDAGAYTFDAYIESRTPGSGLRRLDYDLSMSMQAVPEPSTFVMAVGGLVACGLLAARRRRSG